MNADPHRSSVIALLVGMPHLKEVEFIVKDYPVCILQILLFAVMKPKPMVAGSICIEANRSSTAQSRTIPQQKTTRRPVAASTSLMEADWPPIAGSRRTVPIVAPVSGSAVSTAAALCGTAMLWTTNRLYIPRVRDQRASGCGSGAMSGTARLSRTESVIGNWASSAVNFILLPSLFFLILLASFVST